MSNKPQANVVKFFVQILKKGEGDTVRIAPVHPQVIPNGIASCGLLAHILCAKFEDALPFDRQEKQFARLGVDLNRTAMCYGAMKAARQCAPLLELLKKDLLSGPPGQC